MQSGSGVPGGGREHVGWKVGSRVGRQRADRRVAQLSPHASCVSVGRGEIARVSAESQFEPKLRRSHCCPDVPIPVPCVELCRR